MGFIALTASQIADKFREADPEDRCIIGLMYGGTLADWEAMPPEYEVSVLELRRRER